jgi:MFS family permease
MNALSFLRTNAPWLSAGFLLTMLSGFGQTYFISIFAGEIRAEFNLSHGEWGGIYTLGTGASAVVMVWAGALTDKFRIRTLGFVILPMVMLACFFMAGVTAAWLLPFVIFALRFSGQGMMSHLAVVAMARWFVAARGRALAIAGLGFSVGEAFLPLVFVSLLAVLDWRLLWVASGFVALAGVPILYLLLRKERTPQSFAEEDQSLGMQGQHWTRGQTIRHPLFWFMVPALLGPPAFGTAFFFQQVHYANIKGLEHIQLVSLFPIYTGLSILSMMVAGWVLDKVGTARLIPWIQLPMIAAFCLFGFADGLGLIVLGIAFFATTTGAQATVPNAFWAEFYGTRHLGSIKALASAIMVLGSALGPGITGTLIDLGVGLETQYVFIAAFFVVTTSLMWLGIRRARTELPAAS